MSGSLWIRGYLWEPREAQEDLMTKDQRRCVLRSRTRTTKKEAKRPGLDGGGALGVGVGSLRDVRG